MLTSSSWLSTAKVAIYGVSLTHDHLYRSHPKYSQTSRLLASSGHLTQTRSTSTGQTLVHSLFGSILWTFNETARKRLPNSSQQPTACRTLARRPSRLVTV